MRLIALALFLAACSAPEPRIECATHSIAETGGGLVECHAVGD